MTKECTRGRVTIPTDVDVVPETLELVERWGLTPSVTVTELITRKN